MLETVRRAAAILKQHVEYSGAINSYSSFNLLNLLLIVSQYLLDADVNEEFSYYFLQDLAFLEKLNINTANSDNISNKINNFLCLLK